MKMTIGKRIVGGFFIILTLTAGLGGFAYQRLVAIDGTTRAVAHDALPGLICATDISSGTRKNFIRLSQHVNTEDNNEMARLSAEMAKIRESVGAAFKKYEDDINAPEERQLFNKVEQARPAYLEAFKSVETLSTQHKSEEARQLMQTKLFAAYKNYMDGVEALEDYNQKTAEDAGKASLETVAATKHIVLIAIGVAILAAMVVAYFIIRGVTKALTRMAESLGDGSTQVASAASQVSASSQSLAQGASEQAASLEETSSALEEMSSMTRKNAETAQQASALSGEAKSAADKGNTAMTRMASAINDIQKSASETAKIIKVIDEIAFQTNLLALNAAVEAARAGEAGKGFAVVAEEVRNLAMRSAEAAKNTAAMIEESVQNSRNGVSIAGEVGKVLEEITQASAKVNALVGEIAAASQEQSQGIGQVNTAVTQMDKVTQSNAAAAEESASASEELAAQATQMTGVVKELMALVGVKIAESTHTSPSKKYMAPTLAAHKPAGAKPRVVIPLESTPVNGGFGEFNQAA
jgi:methyl-accepting chemotaxis protein